MGYKLERLDLPFYEHFIAFTPISSQFYLIHNIIAAYAAKDQFDTAKHKKQSINFGQLDCCTVQRASLSVSPERVNHVLNWMFCWISLSHCLTQWQITILFLALIIGTTLTFLTSTSETINPQAILPISGDCGVMALSPLKKNKKRRENFNN